MRQLSLGRRPPSSGSRLSEPDACPGCAVEEEEKGKNKLECAARSKEYCPFPSVVVPCPYFSGMFQSA